MENPLAGKRWHGRWIWPVAPPIRIDGGNPSLDRRAARAWACMRRTFTLTTVPEAVPARFTADSRYVLWVNGTEVSRGPVRSHPSRLHYDWEDLTPLLAEGENTIAVLARFYGEPTAWWMPARPTFGLGGGSFVFEARLGAEATPDGQVWLSSDDAWRGVLSDAWDQGALAADNEPGVLNALAPERFDARQLAAAWTGPGFDDAAWDPVTVLATNHVGWDGDQRPPNLPFGPLLPRPIPPLAGDTRDATVAGAAVVPSNETISDPIAQVGSDLEATPAVARLDGEALPFEVSLTDEFDAGVLILDFGEQVSGTVAIEVDAPAGTIIDAKAAEAVDSRGVLEALQQRSGFRYVARGDQDRFETFDPIGLRYLALSMRGTGDVSLRRAQVHERLAPREPGPFFECSDPLLNQIWEVGRRTVDLCSHDAYLDCPSREQRAWTGDAVVHQMVDLVTNPDWSLPRWNLELGASPRQDGMLPMAAGGDLEHADGTYIPDWALHWVHALYNIGRYTGDEDLIRQLLPVAERVLQWFIQFQADDGLLTNVTGWVIIDWSAVSTAGKSGALNALWGRGLREFQKLADQVGDGGRARWAGRLWVHLRRDFQRFWDPSRELFVDHLPDGPEPEDKSAIPVSQHTNAAAVTARLTRGIDVQALLDKICDPDRLVYAAWLAPDRDARLGADDKGDMYAGFTYLVTGTPEPWWDTREQIVAAQPFFRYVLHDAAADAERADLIPELCRDWKALLERSSTTWSEVWYGGSYCHAWCSTPTRDLMQYTLGVTPAQPGFERARVAPSLGGLAWARGALPTPKGLLRIDIQADRVTLETPVEATVVFGGIDTRVAPGTHELTPS